MAKHAVIVNSAFHGMEFGMLRDFESEICRITGAERIALPQTRTVTLAQNRMGRSMRLGWARRFLPKTELSIDADVVWVILMCPSNFDLDLFVDIGKRATRKILYCFDTFDSHFADLRQILSEEDWTVRAISFHGAKRALEEATRAEWTVVPQGVKLSRFRPAAFSERLIGFSSYGRRVPRIHEAVRDFCSEEGIYYDYTTWNNIAPGIDVEMFYQQYAWHLGHSMFTVSYPTDVTHPERVSGYSPVTCRWFEAAASATPIVGGLPSAPEYAGILGSDFCLPVDPAAPPAEIRERLASYWGDRERHSRRAGEIHESCAHRWTWEARVKQILEML